MSNFSPLKGQVKKLVSRAELLEFIEKSNKSVSLNKIFTRFKVKSKVEQKALHNRLSAMVKDKQLIKRKKAYLINTLTKFYTGIVYEHPNGYGFVDFKNKDNSLFLNHKHLSSLMTGDEVYVSRYSW